MEITELNLISDFEAGIKCLQNPSLISNLSSLTKLPQLYSFWTYLPLLFALFATFTNIFYNIKTFIYQTLLKPLLSSHNSYPQQIFPDVDSDFDFSDDDTSDDFDTPSSVADSDYDDHLDDHSDHNGCTNDVFRIEGDNNNIINNNKGNFTLRRRNGFSWSDFSSGKSVVQLWDSFGLGLDFEDDDDNEIAIWDMDQEVKLSSGRRVTAAVAAETVVLTAEVGGVSGGSGVGFGTYDSRVDEKSPAIYAVWRPRRRNV